MKPVHHKKDTAESLVKTALTLAGGDKHYESLMVGVLNDATQSWHSRMAFLRNGGILRLKDGLRGVWRGGPEGKPTKAERAAAKKRLKPARQSMSSDCPCCERRFCIPSDWISVKEHGVCDSCALYVIEDKWDGVMRERSPTLEEALEIPRGDLRMAEAEVIREAFLKLQGVSP